MPRTNSLYNPFDKLKPCLCPVCYNETLAMDENTHILSMIDGDGLVVEPICLTFRHFTCLHCGFMSTKFIPTDKGWRYNPNNNGEYIINANKIRKSDVTLDINPLVKENDE